MSGAADAATIDLALAAVSGAAYYALITIEKSVQEIRRECRRAEAPYGYDPRLVALEWSRNNPWRSVWVSWYISKRMRGWRDIPWPTQAMITDDHQARKDAQP